MADVGMNASDFGEDSLHSNNKVIPNWNEVNNIHFGIVQCRSSGDHVKLHGWVAWRGRVSYPTCPTCNCLMDIPLLQLEAGKWVEHGSIAVVVCPTCDMTKVIWQD